MGCLMDESRRVNIENAVLCSFLFMDDVQMGGEHSFIFELNTKIFTSKYRQSVAEQINKESAGDRCFSMLNVTLEEKTHKTVYESNWLDILGQSWIPLTLAKQYYRLLEQEYRNRIIRSVR